MEETLPPFPPCLEEAIERITRRFNPVKIILFGSWSRGDANEESDLDLLIILPEIEHKRRATIEALRALNGLGVSKDVVAATPEEAEARREVIGDILRPALQEGRVVYERS